MVYACPLVANRCTSTDYKCRNVHSCVVGILCGTITGKKKKKMMYLTAKNAGKNTLHTFHHQPISLVSFLQLANTTVPVIGQSLTGTSCRSTKRWQRCRRSRGRHWFWLVLRELAGAVWRTDWWSSIRPASAPLYHVSAWQKANTLVSAEVMEVRSWLST